MRGGQGDKSGSYRKGASSQHRCLGSLNSRNHFSVFGPGETLWASGRRPQGEAAGKESPFRPGPQGGRGQ